MTSIKEKMIDIIQKQPEDSSFDEIFRELALAFMVERGLSDAQKKKTISNQEMKRRIQAWQK